MRSPEGSDAAAQRGLGLHVIGRLRRSDFGRRDFGLDKAAWRKSCEETSKRSLHCSAVFECVFDYNGVMDTPICDPEFLARQETSRQAFDALIHAHDQLLAAEVAELVTITHTADLWQVDTAAVDAGIEQLIQPGHDGTPQVGEFLALELGPVLGISPQAAISRIGNALDLRERHPLLWQAVLAGKVRVWQANRICLECAHLPAAAAREVDQKLSQAAATMPWSRVIKALPGLIIAADPDLARQRAEARRDSRRVRVSKIEDGHVSFWGVVNPVDGILFDHVLTQIATTLPALPETIPGTDLDRRRAVAVGILARQALGQEALPTHTLIVHIAADDPALTAGASSPASGVARIADWGPLLTEQLPAFLDGSKVVVRPIVDPAGLRPADCYETPARIRFAIEQRNPVDVFPWGTRKASHCDMDHTIPYIDGRAGQTSLANLGPLSRKAHRAKTHSKWTLEQPAPGIYHWTSPHGYHYQVTPHGTTRVSVPPTEEADHHKRFETTVAMRT